MRRSVHGRSERRGRYEDARTAFHRQVNKREPVVKKIFFHSFDAWTVSSFPPTTPLSREMATPNPFLAIRTRLRDAFNPRTISPSNSTQISFISGLLGIVLLTTLATLVIRVRKGSFWVVRWSGTQQGYFITPHPVNCYLIGSFVFLVGASLPRSA